MAKTLLLIFSLIAQHIHAQSLQFQSGARSWGMAHAVVAMPHSQSYFSNPAGLAFLNQVFVNSSVDSRFNIQGLNTVSLSAGKCTPKFALAIGLERFGDKLYNENKAGLAIAKKTERIALGLKASYLGYLAENYTSSSTLLTEFGVMAKLSKLFYLGLNVENITGAKFANGYVLPTVIRSGFNFRPGQKINFNAELSYVPETPLGFRAGLEYNLQKSIYLRTGVDSALKTNHFGLGFWQNKWQFDYAVHTHPALGISHHMSLSLSPFQAK